MGLASRASPNVPLDTSHALEICSLSKTLGAAFMLEYFTAKGISAETKVNALLRQAGCKFQLKSQPGSPPEWAEEVSLRQLVDHSSLGMHYVNGVPLSKPMPPVEALLSGSPENPAPYGYACLDLTKKPGSSFHYSGGGFLVLQLLLEYLEGKGIADIMDPFVAASGPSVSKQMSFHQDLPSMKYATGYKEGDTGPVEVTRMALQTSSPYMYTHHSYAHRSLPHTIQLTHVIPLSWPAHGTTWALPPTYTHGGHSHDAANAQRSIGLEPGGDLETTHSRCIL